MPQNAAGMRIEPRVSEPSAITHMPSACATAAPEDEPPGIRPVLRSQGFRRAVVRVDAGGAESELHHVGSPDEHRARGAQPRDGRRIRIRFSLRTFEPARVMSPATSNKSLIDTGSPSTGERRTPLLRSRSE